MNLVGNIAPPAVGVLLCAIAYVSVRRAYQKGRDPVPPPKHEPAE